MNRLMRPLFRLEYAISRFKKIAAKCSCLLLMKYRDDDDVITIPTDLINTL